MLPFFSEDFSDAYEGVCNNTTDVEFEDPHLDAVKRNSKNLSVVHINTQSMVSTFDHLLIVIERYSFDIISKSKTCLKNNSLLLQHVTIPGYTHAFNNRDKIKGGGVGVFIKEPIKFKRRTDIEERYPSLEHLWLELPGRNKNSKVLFGVLYRSELLLPYRDWLELFECLVTDLVSSWDGMLALTGDLNVDLLRPNAPDAVRFLELLDAVNLKQIIIQATRITRRSETLLDHIITNLPRQVTHTDVTRGLMISDHDAPYACLNVRVNRFVPRYKCIRHEKNFDQNAFTRDFAELPLSVIYSSDDPDEQLEMLSKLFRECIDRHAPLKRTRFSHPLAPWLKELNFKQLQRDCQLLRTRTRTDKVKVHGRRNVRKEMHSRLIKKTKREFYQKALSSKKPKQVWQVIHRILHPSPQPLTDELSAFFGSTAERVTGAEAQSIEKLFDLVNSFPVDKEDAFCMRPVTCAEVIKEIKFMRSDCSCGPDSIFVKFVKMVAESLASPLTNILNNCISKQVFPRQWKIARISPIPKVNDIKSKNDLRPISILPVLSKVFERLDLKQKADFLSNPTNGILKDSMSAYRKGHNTTTVLLAMRDDILQAMQRGEVTMAVLADYSKTFDIVANETVLKKMHSIGFSKDYLRWLISRLTGRQQFVQIHDKVSDYVNVTFGVPQGSILGPVLFNIYVNYLSDNLDSIKSY